MDLLPKYKLLILFAIAFVAVWLVYPLILRIARKSNALDSPDARKLHSTPVPVLGGIAIFFGVMVGLGFFKTLFTYQSLFPVVMSMTIMLYIGAMDDILGLPAGRRFLLEIMVALLMIYGNRFFISNLQGLWGIEMLSTPVGLFLSVLTFVGVVNAMNMIDGIDGLSSSFTILACGAFGLVFFLGHAYSYAALSVVTIGAVIPFFLHNVFGLKTKMFIGDAGTMLVGTLISSMIFELLRGSFPMVFISYTGMDFNLAAFCVAVMAIPVSDTLRVMTERVLHGRSPFHPDKTHLHHYFIGNGFSFIFTTIAEITMNLLVIAAFFISWKMGAGAGVQMYVTIAVAAVLSWGGAAVLRRVSKRRIPVGGDTIGRLATRSHVERKGVWLGIQKLVDGEKYNNPNNYKNE